MSEHTFNKRGRTGREGFVPKMIGAFAFLVGLIWFGIAFGVSEGISPFVLPVCFLVVGVISFLIGRGIARSSALGARG